MVMYATIHDEMLESIKHLDEATQGKVMLAYIKYQIYWEEPSNEDVLVYSIFKAKQFDLDSTRTRAEINRENGMKWWRPRKVLWGENRVKTEITENNPTETETKPKETQKNQEKEKEKEKENKKEIKEKRWLDDVLLEFKEMRKMIKKPITDRWLELVRTKVMKMYPDREDLQIMCINKSIENSWQWIFELKNEDIRLYKKKLDEEKKKEVRENLSERVIEMSEEDKARIRKQYEELRRWVLRSV